jgi:hypothetical protein
MNKSKWMGPSHAMITAFAFAAGGTVSAAAEPDGAPHGAMPMQEQQQRLDQLIKRSIDPPSGIDPVAWATIYHVAPRSTLRRRRGGCCRPRESDCRWYIDACRPCQWVSCY